MATSGERERGRGNIRMGEWEVLTVGCKIVLRMYCTTWRIQPIFAINKIECNLLKVYKNKKIKTFKNYINIQNLF